MTTHTPSVSPGPFRFAKQWDDPDEQNRIEYQILSRGGECVAVVYGTDDGDCAGPESAEANGRLIADCLNALAGINPEAVPMMMEALEKAGLTLEAVANLVGKTTHGTEADTLKARTAISAALALAKGLDAGDAARAALAAAKGEA